MATCCSGWDLGSPSRDCPRAPARECSLLTVGPAGNPRAFWSRFEPAHLRDRASRSASWAPLPSDIPSRLPGGTWACFCGLLYTFASLSMRLSAVWRSALNHCRDARFCLCRLARTVCGTHAGGVSRTLFVGLTHASGVSRTLFVGLTHAGGVSRTVCGTHARGVPCLRLFTAAGTVRRLAIVPSSALLTGIWAVSRSCCYSLFQWPVLTASL